ncbi:MAG: hypothetical protein HQK66_15515 [Desulfamplus sp.]|nr:hypothetical protein [Desulfamplus sp.]
MIYKIQFKLLKFSIYNQSSSGRAPDSSWKINQISSSGTTLIFNVQQAALDEIIKDGPISFNMTPDWSSGQFDIDDANLLQKDAKAYFTPSRRNQRILSGSNVDSAGTINLDDTSLFEFTTKYDASKGKYVVDWGSSTIMGIYLGFDYKSDPSCQGCCSWHGGVVCNNGITTTCADDKE